METESSGPGAGCSGRTLGVRGCLGGTGGMQGWLRLAGTLGTSHLSSPMGQDHALAPSSHGHLRFSPQVVAATMPPEEWPERCGPGRVSGVVTCSSSQNRVLRPRPVGKSRAADFLSPHPAHRRGAWPRPQEGRVQRGCLLCSRQHDRSYPDCPRSVFLIL